MTTQAIMDGITHYIEADCDLLESACGSHTLTVDRVTKALMLPTDYAIIALKHHPMRYHLGRGLTQFVTIQIHAPDSSEPYGQLMPHYRTQFDRRTGKSTTHFNGFLEAAASCP